jgi:hypothetical protein
MYYSTAFVKVCDLCLPSSDEADKCNKLPDKLRSGFGLKQVIRLSMMELDLGTPLRHIIDIDVTNSVKVATRKRRPVN